MDTDTKRDSDKTNSKYYYPDYLDENFVNDISNRLEFQINLPKKDEI